MIHRDRFLHCFLLKADLKDKVKATFGIPPKTPVIIKSGNGIDDEAQSR